MTWHEKTGLTYVHTYTIIIMHLFILYYGMYLLLLLFMYKLHKIPFCINGVLLDSYIIAGIHKFGQILHQCTQALFSQLCNNIHGNEPMLGN